MFVTYQNSSKENCREEIALRWFKIVVFPKKFVENILFIRRKIIWNTKENRAINFLHKSFNSRIKFVLIAFLARKRNFFKFSSSRGRLNRGAFPKFWAFYFRFFYPFFSLKIWRVLFTLLLPNKLDQRCFEGLWYDLSDPSFVLLASSELTLKNLLPRLW